MSEHGGFGLAKTTLIGGALFLVPVVVVVLVLGKAIGFMMLVAEPMASFLPVDTVGGVALANLLALVGMLLVCYLAGLIARIGLEIEKLQDGRSVVYMPSPPNAWSGVTQILPPDQIEYLDVPAKAIFEYTEQFNRGTDALLGKVISSPAGSEARE